MIGHASNCYCPMALHDSGTKHKDNVQRFLRQVQKDEEASKEAEKKLSTQLKTIEKAATLSYSKDIAARGGENATETGTNTQGAPSKDALAKSKVATNQTHKPPQSSETGPALAAEANPKPNRPADIGVIGEWEVVEDEVAHADQPEQGGGSSAAEPEQASTLRGAEWLDEEEQDKEDRFHEFEIKEKTASGLAEPRSASQAANDADDGAAMMLFKKRRVANNRNARKQSK
ncbi:hypothetical protein EV174_004237 [Coemansia sp. RSA 2320]|nr:hypothetical protein EV174_004237 [Coemansia sp. RSA 2320]